MRFLVSFLAALILLPSLAVAVPAHAQSAGAELQGRLERLGDSAYQGQNGDQLPEIVGNLIKIFLSILGVLFVVLMVYAGYLWMNARGNEQQVEKAKNILSQAVIGLVVILGAYSITYFVVNGLTKATGYQEGVGPGASSGLPAGSNRFGTP